MLGGFWGFLLVFEPLRDHAHVSEHGISPLSPCHFLNGDHSPPFDPGELISIFVLRNSSCPSFSFGGPVTVQTPMLPLLSPKSPFHCCTVVSHGPFLTPPGEALHLVPQVAGSLSRAASLTASTYFFSHYIFDI